MKPIKSPTHEKNSPYDQNSAQQQPSRKVTNNPNKSIKYPDFKYLIV